MAHVSINLEDEDGKIAMMIRHTDGFDPHSPAHALSMQIVKFLDEQAATKERERLETPPELCVGSTAPSIVIARGGRG